MKVSIKQIAQEANVSIGAVSQVLKGIGRVSPAKKQEILAIAERLKYRPNLLVRSIQSGKTNMIGVMMSIRTGFSASVFSGICDALDERDRVPLVIRGNPGGNDGNAFEIRQLHRLIDRRVDGLMILSCNLDLGNGRFMKEFNGYDEIPRIVLDLEVPGIGADFSGVDNILGAKIAAEYLVSMGHRHLGHFAANDDKNTAVERLEGFGKAVKKAGLKYTLIKGAPGIWGGNRDGLLKLLSDKKNRPSAFFCSNDYMASELYEAAFSLSLKIPEDISVVGFGNLDFGMSMLPGLTTIDQFSYQMGRDAVDILIRRIDGNLTGKPIKHFLKPELRIRSSVAKLN